MKYISWNINGIRAAIKKGLWEKLDQLEVDVVCFQETKADSDIMSQSGLIPENWDIVFHSCTLKKGYSGVATLVRKSSDITIVSSRIGLGDEEFDVEGRVVTTELHTKDISIVLINAYYPQGGRDGRIPYKIKFYECMHEYAESFKKLGKSVVLCGDFNTTVGDIDLARPKENRSTTGCLPEERDALNLFLKNGYIDTFRTFYPDTIARYSYWDQITRARERNVGWRIDYFIVDEAIISHIKKAEILDDILGSDHCPVMIEI
jgi:exodeoxyribonuclease III